MTCFWDALRNKLCIKENNHNFILYLKKNNKKQNSVLWNNIKLTQKQLEENFEHIKDFNEKKIYNGYDCSTCDPFLILISELYNIDIFHDYNGHKIMYTKKSNSKTLKFKSNRHHFT